MVDTGFFIKRCIEKAEAIGAPWSYTQLGAGVVFKIIGGSSIVYIPSKDKPYSVVGPSGTGESFSRLPSALRKL